MTQEPLLSPAAINRYQRVFETGAPFYVNVYADGTIGVPQWTRLEAGFVARKPRKYLVRICFKVRS